MDEMAVNFPKGAPLQTALSHRAHPAGRWHGQARGLVLFVAAGYRLSLIMVKRLTGRCSPGAIVVWMILIQLPLGSIAALSDWRPVSVTDVFWMLFAAGGALSARFPLRRCGGSRRLSSSPSTSCARPWRRWWAIKPVAEPSICGVSGRRHHPAINQQAVLAERRGAMTGALAADSW